MFSPRGLCHCMLTWSCDYKLKIIPLASGLVVRSFEICVTASLWIFLCLFPYFSSFWKNEKKLWLRSDSQNFLFCHLVPSEFPKCHTLFLYFCEPVFFFFLRFLFVRCSLKRCTCSCFLPLWFAWCAVAEPFLLVMKQEMPLAAKDFSPRKLFLKFLLIYFKHCAAVLFYYNIYIVAEGVAALFFSFSPALIWSFQFPLYASIPL